MSEIKIDEKQFNQLRSELDSIKKLLVLFLKQKDVKGDVIANALGISEGRLSQIFSQKKYKKVKNEREQDT